jgi:hypothetical protein
MFGIDGSSKNARKVATKAARSPKRLTWVLMIWGQAADGLAVAITTS